MKQRHNDAEIGSLALWLQKQASNARALADADSTTEGRSATLSDAEKFEKIAAILYSLLPRISQIQATHLGVVSTSMSPQRLAQDRG
jgi:hypothetical protein